MARAEIVSELRSSLSVAPTGRSFVVAVTFEAGDPQFAAAVVNEVMLQYLDLDISAQRDLATDAISQISARLRDLRADLDERERALQDFRAQSRIAEGAGTEILADQLSRMNEELTRAQAALAQADAASDLSGSDAGSLPQVVSSPLIQQLRTQAAAQRRTVSELDSAVPAPASAAHPGARGARRHRGDDHRRDTQDRQLARQLGRRRGRAGRRAAAPRWTSCGIS